MYLLFFPMKSVDNENRCSVSTLYGDQIVIQNVRNRTYSYMVRIAISKTNRRCARYLSPGVETTTLNVACWLPRMKYQNERQRPLDGDGGKVSLSMAATSPAE